MKQKSKNKWNWSLFLLGFIIGFLIIFLLSINVKNKSYEEVITRSIIEQGDDILKLMDNREYIEASYLAKAIGTQYWFLRNFYDTKFYDKIAEENNGGIWFLDFSLENIDECFNRVPMSDIAGCSYSEYKVRESIRYLQDSICKKSDLYNSEYIKKNYKKYPEAMENYLNKARC